MPQFTAREVQIMQMIEDGIPQDEVASRLFISPATVKVHVANINGKRHEDGKPLLPTRLAALQAHLRHALLLLASIADHVDARSGIITDTEATELALILGSEWAKEAIK